MTEFVNADEDFIRQNIVELQAIDSCVGWAPWTTDNFLSEVPRKFEYSLAAISDGKIDGFLIGSKKNRHAYVHRIVVRSDRQGTGLGSEFIQTFLERAARIDSDVNLCSLKVDKASRAVDFYTKLGFVQKSTVGATSHVVMLKALPQRDVVLAVHQPNFLPWHGYFAKIMASDVFVFLDDVQMPIGRSYVSRTKVRLDQEDQWLTVPVKKATGAAINQIEIADPEWYGKHIAVIQNRYSRWPHFKPVTEILDRIAAEKHNHLWASNLAFIEAICVYVGIPTPMVLASTLDVTSKSDERIADIAKRLGANHYLSGTGGMNYQTFESYGVEGIELKVQGFAMEPDDTTFSPRSGLTVLESLFAYGPAAKDYLERGIKSVEIPR